MYQALGGIFTWSVDQFFKFLFPWTVSAGISEAFILLLTYSDAREAADY